MAAEADPEVFQLLASSFKDLPVGSPGHSVRIDPNTLYTQIYTEFRRYRDFELQVCGWFSAAIGLLFLLLTKDQVLALLGTNWAWRLSSACFVSLFGIAALLMLVSAKRKTEGTRDVLKGFEGFEKSKPHELSYFTCIFRRPLGAFHFIWLGVLFVTIGAFLTITWGIPKSFMMSNQARAASGGPVTVNCNYPTSTTPAAVTGSGDSARVPRTSPAKNSTPNFPSKDR